jgi:CheY-like chemotaxis protein
MRSIPMSLKVLTVDDSKTIRMIVKKSFRPYDCQIFEAENGVEGLSAASSIKPDLIILDITMPVMNGIEMLEKLRKIDEFQKIPVIMLTAESGKDNVMRIIKMGVKDYMVKPFKPAQLIEKVVKIVALEPKSGEAAKDSGGTDYFSLDGDVQKLSIPEKISRPVVLDIENGLAPKLMDMKKNGVSKIVVDLMKVVEVNVSLIKLILLVSSKSKEAGFGCKLVGNAKLQEDLKGFQETGGMPVYASLDEAKSAF